MWLWCLFIIMRMKISSIWLLPHKLCSVKCCMCPGICRSFCSQREKLEPLLTNDIQQLRWWIFECQENLWLLSLFHHVSIILTQKEQEVTFHYLVLLQKWLDDLIPSFHCFYFLHWKTFPGGLHNHNGFREILSTWPDAGGGYSCKVLSLL